VPKYLAYRSAGSSAGTPAVAEPRRSPEDERSVMHSKSDSPLCSSSRSRAGFPTRDDAPASRLPPHRGHDAVMIRGMPRVGRAATDRSYQTPDPGLSGAAAGRPPARR
jgi:hypothetical protein